ncbi:NAD(P)-binding protein [Tothia fuscella]|uniref:NAD(P)-binding protein n=1 Tax=Tothia fuscella TaxID=1048955 RepID=A0A9P4NS27_9PEZI|nr:NAD(P)-binding protein [Tothia fuscella]
MTSIFAKESEAKDVAAHYAPQIANKVILTTGVSPGGLGAFFVETIAAQKPKLLILAGRDTTKTQETADAIAKAHPNVKTRNLKLDLSDQKQIWEAAKEVLGYEENIDVLVNNAAVMACPYSKTKDGLEMQFGTGHIGHFLFTNMILKKVLEVKGRVINVSSDGHRFSPIRFDDWGFSDGKTYDKWRAYGQTKTANMLFSVALAERYGSQGLTAASLHPGAIWTNLGRHLDKEVGFDDLLALDKELDNYESKYEFQFKNFEQGTATHVYAAFEPSIAEVNGAYCIDARVGKPNEIRNNATDKEQAAKLWKLSEEILGQTFE